MIRKLLWLLGAAVYTALLLPPELVQAANVIDQLSITIDGRFDESCPLGDCAPLTPVLTCDNSAQPDATGLISGQSYSQAVRIYIGGAQAANAVPSFSSITGTDPASVGFTFSGGTGPGGDNLTNAAAGVGSGQFYETWTYPGIGAVTCPKPINWSVVSLVTDNTPPLIPLEITQTASGMGTAQIEWQTVADVGGNANPSGMASYSIRNASTGAVIDTLAAASPGYFANYSTLNLGSGPGTHTCTQSGNQITIADGGSAGMESASDQATLCPTTITGDFTADMTVVSLTTAGDYNKLGWDARDPNAANPQTAASIPCYEMKPNAGGDQLQTWPRLANGATRTGATSILLASYTSLIIRMHRDAAGFDCGYSTDGGQTWTYASIDQGQALPPTILLSPFLTPTNVTKTATGVINQVNISQGGRVSKTISVSIATNIVIRALDLAGNISASSAQFMAIPNMIVTDKRKKWVPGYYIMTARNSTEMNRQSARFTTYDSSGIGGNANLTGVLLTLGWSQFEGPTHGDYTAGKTMLHSELTKLRSLANPKRLIVLVHDEINYSITAGQAAQDAYYPAYLKTAGCLVFGSGTNDTSTGIDRFKWWDTTCRQYMIDMLNAYGSEFDSDGYLVAWGLSYETYIQGTIQNNGGFTETAFDASLAAVATAASSAFPHTNLFYEASYGPQGGNATLNNWFPTWAARGVGWGNGDTCNYAGTFPEPIPGDNITAGYQQVNGVWTAGQSTDFRPKTFIYGKVESSELGYNSVCGTPGMAGNTTVGGYGNMYVDWNTIKQVSHGFIENNTYVGANVQRYINVTNSLLDVVNNHPLSRTACPTDYDIMYGNGSAGSGCNTNP